MAKFLILSDFPDAGDHKKNFSNNEGGYFWHLLYVNNAPVRDLAIEFLYDDYQDIIMGNDKWRSIESKHDPDVIIACGQSVIKKFPEVEGKISAVRGSVFKRRIPGRSKPAYIIPTYHPRDLKKPEKMYGDESIEKAYCASIDIYKAVEVYKNGFNTPPERFNINPTVREVEEMCRYHIEQGTLLGCDLEGTGLNLEHSEIVVFGVAWNESEAMCIPFRTKGGEFYYKGEDWERVKRAVGSLLKKGKFLFQNGVGYDIPLLRARGWEFPLESFEMDTMVEHHTINPEMPHNIGFISSQYGKQPYWKDSFISRNEHIFDTDQDSMRIYNCRDCVALHQIHNGMQKHIKDLIEKNPEVYGKLPEILEGAMDDSRAVITMEEQGLLLDKKKLTVWHKWIDEHLNEIDSKIKNLTNLPPSFNMGSGDHMRFWLYGEEIPKLKKINLKDKLDEYEQKAYNHQFECPVCNRKRTKKFFEKEEIPKTFRFNCPNCKNEKPFRRTDKERTEVKGKDKNTKIYKELKSLEGLLTLKPLPMLNNYVPLASKKGRGDKSATDKGALTRYIMHIDKRLDTLGKLKRRQEKHNQEEKDLKYTRAILVILQEYSKFAKLKESFWTFKTRSDGKVYPHFMVTGTATGRLSAAKPNLN